MCELKIGCRFISVLWLIFVSARFSRFEGRHREIDERSSPFRIMCFIETIYLEKLCSPHNLNHWRKSFDSTRFFFGLFRFLGLLVFQVQLLHRHWLGRPALPGGCRAWCWVPLHLEIWKAGGESSRISVVLRKTEPLPQLAEPPAPRPHPQSLQVPILSVPSPSWKQGCSRE